MLFGIKDEATREYKRIEADSREAAIRLSGFRSVRWAWSLPGQHKVSMSEEVKEQLAQIRAFRKFLRKE